jgi:nitrite reductase/ring-hydroxylating ferredoxin subunit
MSRSIEVIKAIEIAPGGMKAIEVEGIEIVVCNADGEFYAVQRRCGHMNAPLEKGTLDGIILTCAMHCAQFDIRTGESLSGPVPANLGGEALSPGVAKYMYDIGNLIQSIKTHSIRTFPTKLKDGFVMIDL